MLPLELQTPREMAQMLAQQETAERAGLTLATYRRFERTGSIAMDRLLKLAVVLDARAGFDQLFARPPARSLKELAKLDEAESRKRGRRRTAGAGVERKSRVPS